MRPDSQALATFWYWINERHAIWVKRNDNQPKPWTTDSILQEYRFCNVFRELDTVTIEFREMFAPYEKHPCLWFLYCLARQINWPETVAYILEQSRFPDEVWNPEMVYEAMRRRQATGAKLYTGAYMLRGDIQREGEDNNKPRYTVYGVLDPVWRKTQWNTWGDTVLEGDPLSKSIQATTEWFESFSGWGGFLAYEVATDLRHTRYLRNAPDIMTWANPGPGAKRGLNRVYERPLNKSLSREQALDEMRELLRLSPDYLGPHVPALEMRDIEHSLCETDKYLRVKSGEGRPRARYNGKGA